MPPRFPCSDLPSELLDLIATRLDTPTDIRNFRAVCQSWRSSCSLHPHLLSLVLPHNLNSLEQAPVVVSSETLTIIASNTYILEPLHSDSLKDHPKPWLIRVEEHEPGKLRVRQSLTHHLPIKLPESFPKNLFLSRFKILEVSSGYNFSESYGSRWRRLSDKLLLYTPPPPPPPQINKTSNSSLTKEALVLCSGSLYQVHLENEKWNTVKAGRVSKFDDIIRFKEQNYAVDRRGRLYKFTRWWSVHCLIPNPICGNSSGEARKRVAEWCGELYLIRRDRYVIRVYKLNEQEHRWDEVSDLGGKVLFVATDCCFFFTVENLPGWKENTVIFHQESFPTYRGHFYPDNSLFNSSSWRGLLIGVYRWGATRCYRTTSYPDLSDTFWPPPRWVGLVMKGGEEGAGSLSAARCGEASKMNPFLCGGCGETTEICIMSAFKLLEDSMDKPISTSSG